ncbi:hypothetical protein L1987_86878 [Smallanthus sonchifolius]|uniref:Uncharacterized protein n=1 Tax=Smallanthus sonchifolius TaxID=185202 RepID=A0ACB8Y4T0_9ASTR|nr:hypothetical protein L1987_86878 [Smallanthus sonchifolius]
MIFSRKRFVGETIHVFKYLEDETVDDIVSKYYHLWRELVKCDVSYTNTKVNEKLLDALPPKFEKYSVLIKKSEDLTYMSLEELIGTVYAYEEGDVTKVSDKSDYESDCFSESSDRESFHSSSSEIKSEVHTDAGSDISSSDSDLSVSGSVAETEESIIQNAEPKFSTKDLLDDGAAGKVTEKITEMLSKANASMADSKHIHKVISCSKCIDSDLKIVRLCDDNTNLICDMKAIYTSNQVLKENEMVLNARIESLKDDIKILQIKVNEQAFHIDVEYSEYEKKINKLAQLQSEVTKLLRKLEGYKNSSFLLEYYNEKASSEKVVGGVSSCPSFDEKAIRGGVGYYIPFNGNYTSRTTKERTMVYDDSSDDETFDLDKFEGTVKDCKVDEPVVVKKVTRDRCILTEPDEDIEQPQPKPVKKFVSSGFNFQENNKIEKTSTLDVIKTKVDSEKPKVVQVSSTTSQCTSSSTTRVPREKLSSLTSETEKKQKIEKIVRATRGAMSCLITINLLIQRLDAQGGDNVPHKYFDNVVLESV